MSFRFIVGAGASVCALSASHTAQATILFSETFDNYTFPGSDPQTNNGIPLLSEGSD